MKKLLLLLLTITCFDLPAQMPKILDLQTRGELRDQWLKGRIETVLPGVMRREGIDMWVLLSREYNEDPVLKTMLPSKWLSARRTTMLVIYDEGEKLETLACARYDVGEVFKKSWDKDSQPDQWARLSEIIEERNPKKIAINRSEHFALADGISSYHYDKFKASLKPKYQNRIVSGEKVAIGWLETRSAAEMIVYKQIVAIAHEIISEGFSEQVIQPGVTTTQDVVWWYRDRIRELGLLTWFHPTVDVQRKDPENFDHLRTFDKRPDRQVILPGDLIHVDFGISYLGLHTDTQENAYVLKADEKEAPAYLVDAHKKALRLMDIFTNNFETGKTGNEILLSSRNEAIAEGLKPSIYTHPLGYHGHAAGPTIGMWDQQEGVPVRGDYPLYANTCYAIELNAAVFIKEWDKEVRMMMEEDACYSGKSVRYINGRQTKLFLIPREREQLGD